MEQLIGASEVDGRDAVIWLTVFGSGRSFLVIRHVVEDIGTEDYLDVSSFPPLDEDEYAGEGVEVGEADSPEGALSLAVGFGASPDRWVNEGVVQDEYAEARPPR